MWRWLKRLAAQRWWQFREPSESRPRRVPTELLLHDGRIVRPVSVLGLTLLCRTESGSNEVVLSNQAADVGEFWKAFHGLGGRLNRYSWDDGTPAEHDPPAM